MSANMVGKGYIFVIDTEEYTGNFVRELCAYVVGIIGDCGVGEKAKEQFNKDFNIKEDTDNPFEEIIKQVRDGHNCARPASIWQTPGWYNNGNGGHYIDDGTEDDKALKEYKEVKIAYSQDQIERISLNREEEDTPENRNRGAWTKTAKASAIKSHKLIIEKTEMRKKIKKYPSYQSVAIFFHKRLTPEKIQIMIERVMNFSKDTALYSRLTYREANPVKITGFRILEVVPETYKSVMEYGTVVAKIIDE